MTDAIFGIAVLAAAVFLACWALCWLADLPGAEDWLGDDDDH